MIAASVAPVACPAAAAIVTWLDAATTNAAVTIPSHAREPYRMTAASATPYAGHTGPRLLLLMWMVACPSLPATR